MLRLKFLLILCTAVHGMELEVSCPLEEIMDFSIISFCERNGKDINCTDHLPPGTKATIRCQFNYKQPPRINPELTCDESGNWSPKAYKCKPICGRLSRHSNALQIGGKAANLTTVPWHVGIYEHDIQICGGTIISERVVISASHCFSNNSDQMHKTHYKSFKVAAGKIVRGLYENETQAIQIRDVQEVEISHKFDYFNNLWANIATITIKGHFAYQPHIMPACSKFIKNPDDWYPKNESKALVTGWGLNKYQSSDTLQSFDFSVMNFDSCKENMPRDFKIEVLKDKICAGYMDSNENHSKEVCKGDLGSGLLISQTVGVEKHYYLQGVFSTSEYAKDCDNSYYTLFTRFHYYKRVGGGGGNSGSGISFGGAPFISTLGGFGRAKYG